MKLHTKTEKERICQEKQRLNDEKKKCRLIEKEKRENERLEAKINKERERQEKEKQRAEQKKQKEDERLQKIEQLKQEKKKKEDARLEEKRKKEEKRDRQEEKVVKEKELMQRFFVAVKETPAFKCQDIKGGPFMDFEVKENMHLAPLCRVDTLTAKDAARNLEKHFIEQDSVLLYLDELKSGAFRPRTSPPTWPCLEADVTVITAANSSACFMRAKLLQFHDNNRPAYYGTWRKHSRIINPRNPLQRDTSVFDYEVDSDDEWEEEEPGESLSHSEDDDDDETEAEQDEEGDGFFCPTWLSIRG
jgi:chromatin assembly factor 1 subunit A